MNENNLLPQFSCKNMFIIQHFNLQSTNLFSFRHYSLVAPPITHADSIFLRMRERNEFDSKVCERILVYKL